VALNNYHFITHWRVQGTLEEVTAIIADAPALSRWWPAVYLDVQELAPGDATGVGRVISLYTKGWLSYTLRWQFRVSEIVPLCSLTLEADGDFVGRGIWTFAQDGLWVNLTYDWKIEARKPLLRALSFLFKPIFSANHRWAMTTGEESLRLELARRHAKSEYERTQMPPPPSATPSSTLAWFGYVVKSSFRQQSS
jgi:hypothetical protein